jgi:hypothetical protein
MRDSMLEIWEDISSDEDDGNDNKGADDDIQPSNGCVFRSGHGQRILTARLDEAPPRAA